MDRPVALLAGLISMFTVPGVGAAQDVSRDKEIDFMNEFAAEMLE